MTKGLFSAFLALILLSAPTVQALDDKDLTCDQVQGQITNLSGLIKLETQYLNTALRGIEAAYGLEHVKKDQALLNSSFEWGMAEIDKASKQIQNRIVLLKQLQEDAQNCVNNSVNK